MGHRKRIDVPIPEGMDVNVCMWMGVYMCIYKVEERRKTVQDRASHAQWGQRESIYPGIPVPEVQAQVHMWWSRLVVFGPGEDTRDRVEGGSRAAESQDGLTIHDEIRGFWRLTRMERMYILRHICSQQCMVKIYIFHGVQGWWCWVPVDGHQWQWWQSEGQAIVGPQGEEDWCHHSREGWVEIFPYGPAMGMELISAEGIRLAQVGAQDG